MIKFIIKILLIKKKKKKDDCLFIYLFFDTYISDSLSFLHLIRYMHLLLPKKILPCIQKSVLFKP